MTTKRITRMCSVENCELRHYANGYCSKHNSRFKKYGDAMHPVRKRTDKPRPERICTITDCQKSVHKQGLCSMHWSRLDQYGDPLREPLSHIPLCINPECTFHSRKGGLCYRCLKKIPKPKLSLEERFWTLVDKTPGQGPDGECWEWQGYCPYGYGELSFNGKRVKATRLSWELANNKVATLHILHSCHNPPCVNPEHLRQGTPADNAKDKVEAGRQPKGEKTWNAKLTEENVRYLRQEVQQGRSRQELALELGIARSTLDTVARGDNWKHVT